MSEVAKAVRVAREGKPALEPIEGSVWLIVDAAHWATLPAELDSFLGVVFRDRGQAERNASAGQQVVELRVVPVLEGGE